MAILGSICDSDKTMNYINDYPAFKNTYGYFINNGFYADWFEKMGEFLSDYYDDENDPHFGEQVKAVKKQLKDYLQNRVHMTLSEFETYVLPVIRAAMRWNDPADLHSVNMKKAEYFLRYIEPAWCDFKGIDRTGYLPDSELERAAELLADNEFEDI